MNLFGDATIFRNTASGIRGQIDTNGNVQFGNSIYAPVTSGAKFLGAAFTGTTAVVNGVWANDGVASPRAELFARGDGVSAGTVGLDWVFSTGVSNFEFRRAGATIFNYNDQGLAVINGLNLDVFAANNTTLCRFKVDSNATAYWNTSGGATNFQWYIENNLRLTLRAGKLEWPNTGGNDFLLASAVAGGAIQFRGDGSTANRGLLIGAIDNAGAFTTYIQLGDFLSGQIAFHTNLDMYNGKNIRFFDSSNSAGYTLHLPDGGITKSPVFVGYGALMYHAEPSYAFGGIYVSTSAAPGTGGTPGQFWLQVDA
jgi:hypothetical protein